MRAGAAPFLSVSPAAAAANISHRLERYERPISGSALLLLESSSAVANTTAADPNQHQHTKQMNTTTTGTKRTVVRHPAHLVISGYSVQASDPYGDINREVIDIIGDSDQIMTALVDWCAQRHRDAQGGSNLAKEDLARIAGAMGLAYGFTTEET